VAKKDEPRDTLTAALAQTVESRLRASQLRFRATDPNLEKPKDVTEQFVRDAALRMQDAGQPSKLVTSRREIQITRGDLTFFISFQSSHNNTAGATIVLWPHMGVRSKALRFWRRDKPWATTYGFDTDLRRSDDGMFIGAMLGNFFWPRQYVALELIDPKNREPLLRQTLSQHIDVETRLRDALRDRESFLTYASSPKSDIECMSDNACEYVAATWGLSTVQDYVRRLLNAHELDPRAFANLMSEARRDPKTLKYLSIHGAVRFFLAHDLQLN
jgi:hypothetical protein